jgi:hypothetical protein
MTRFAAVALTFAMSASAAVKIEKTSWKGWPNCYRISNGQVELIVTTDVGPRVMRYGFVGGQNLFKEFTEQLGKSGEKEWMARGGHRIWIAPEDVKDTYALDNSPIKAVVSGDAVTLVQPVEPETGLEKQIMVRLQPTGSRVEVIHKIRNTRNSVREFASWALTMMAQGGHGVTGFPPRGTHPEQLAPTNPLVMWAFTDLSDPRWSFTKKYMVLRQDPKNTGQPQKLGTFNPQTWGAYVLNGEVFIKRYKADPSKAYPDFNSSYETFTNQDMLELETLGPLQNVQSGQTVEHTENWSLHRGVKISSWTDAEIDRALLPLMQ